MKIATINLLGPHRYDIVDLYDYKEPDCSDSIGSMN